MGKLNFAGSAICSPVAGQAFAECESFPSNWASFRGARIVPQLLGKLSQGFESLPSCWASFRRGSNRSPAAGQTFVALSRKNYQSVFTSNE